MCLTSSRSEDSHHSSQEQQLCRFQVPQAGVVLLSSLAARPLRGGRGRQVLRLWSMPGGAALTLAGVGVAVLKAALPAAAWSQGSPMLLSPPPPVPACVARYGHTGCAARLYAEVLCEVVGQRADLYRALTQLQRRFSDEHINFNGITAEQVEVTAARYYVPQLCPPKRQQVWDLLLLREAG